MTSITWRLLPQKGNNLILKGTMSLRYFSTKAKYTNSKRTSSERIMSTEWTQNTPILTLTTIIMKSQRERSIFDLLPMFPPVRDWTEITDRIIICSFLNSLLWTLFDNHYAFSSSNKAIINFWGIYKLKLITYFAINKSINYKMNTTSFQSSIYKHSFQSGVHGTSGLKIMDGEDLSNKYW